MEVPFLTGTVLDQVIQAHSGESIDAALRGEWLGGTEEMVALIAWAKDRNQLTDEQQVRIVGFDVSRDLDCIRELQAARDSAVDAELRPAIDSLTHGRLRRSKRARARARASLLTLKSAVLEREPGGAVLPAASRCLQAIDSMESYLQDQSQSRDAHMAENLLRELERFPDSRAVVIGHNEHVWVTPVRYPNGRVAPPPMGAYLRARLGSKYVVLTTLVGRGTFLAHAPAAARVRQRFVGGRIREFPLPAPGPYVLEWHLERSGSRLVATTHAVGGSSNDWVRVRSIANTWLGDAPAASDVEVDILRATDVVVFFSHVSAAHLLE